VTRFAKSARIVLLASFTLRPLSFPRQRKLLGADVRRNNAQQSGKTPDWNCSLNCFAKVDCELLQPFEFVAQEQQQKTSSPSCSGSNAASDVSDGLRDMDAEQADRTGQTKRGVACLEMVG
jgi:hypothetical protein